MKNKQMCMVSSGIDPVQICSAICCKTLANCNVIAIHIIWISCCPKCTHLSKQRWLCLLNTWSVSINIVNLFVVIHRFNPYIVYVCEPWIKVCLISFYYSRILIIFIELIQFPPVILTVNLRRMNYDYFVGGKWDI